MKTTFALELRGVSKVYESKKTVLRDISLQAKRGEILCLLGPSGSGKTTLLRIIAGLESPASGEVYLEDRPLSGVATRERNIGFVFQSTEAVFPHLTVYENVAFPLRVKIRRSSERNQVKQVNEMLSLVRLAAFAAEYPQRLSGGEKQRIAIARALVYEPSLLLLDEPLSSLDNVLKKELLEIILEIRSRFSPTIVYVTHDEREALEVADSIAVLNDGQILQHADVAEITLNPTSAKVAEIIGGWNTVQVKVASEKDKSRLKFEEISFELPLISSPNQRSAYFGVRTSAIQVVEDQETVERSDFIIFPGTVSRITPWYGQRMLWISCGVTSFRVETKTLAAWMEVGTQVFLRIPKAAVKVWPRS